jgi:hypothetical protein
MDPFVVLGISQNSTVEEIRIAWRNKARTCHPDVGGTVQDMQQLNEALELAVLYVLQGGKNRNGGIRDTAGAHEATSHVHSDSSKNSRRASWARISRELASFTIDCLPVEAHEALLIAVSWHGDVVVDESPYLLEAIVRDPYSCWVRFDIVPEAGASMVNVAVATALGEQPVSSEDIRDLFVDSLNQLDWSDLQS